MGGFGPPNSMQDIKAVTEKIFAAHREGNLDLAEAMYDQVLSQLTYPDPNILYGYGSLLVQREKFGTGVLLLEAAARQYDKHAGIWTNLGVAYKYLGKDDLAMAAYERAYAIEPNAVEVLAGMSGYYVNRNASKKAEELARKALAKADHPAAHMHLGLALLEQGRFEEAWPEYEHRWNTAENLKKRRNYVSPVWDGRPVKKLVIHGEQGLGDEILFMSLFAKARERADIIVIECATRLVKLFQSAFKVRCYGTERELMAAEPPEDAHVAMGSLPMVLGLPNGKPYMPKPGGFIRGQRLRVGIAWRGGTLRTNKNYRSLDLAQFKPIFEASNAKFISVQYGDDDVDNIAKEHGLATGPRDFDALQERIGSCDLVISVIQTAVHQAGAMGVPCWALVPRMSSWPFCGGMIKHAYSTVEQFLQAEDGSWDAPIGQIVDRLKQMEVVRAA